MADLAITPLHPSPGARVTGPDRSRPQDAATAAARGRVGAASGAGVSRSGADARSVPPPAGSARRYASPSRSTMPVTDGRATLHRTHGDHDRTRSRVLWRIIVEGDRPRCGN
jgi:hypothetical protein